MNTRKTMVAALVVMWLYSGLQPILTVPTESLQMLARVGVGAAWQWPLLLAASVCDVAVAMWIVATEPHTVVAAMWLGGVLQRGDCAVAARKLAASVWPID